MAKKKKINYFSIILIGIFIFGIIMVYYMGKQGFFKSVVNIENKYPPANPDKIVELNKPPTTIETCTLAITPLAIFTGDSVTGIIQDGKNTRCEIYADIEGWKLIYYGITDNNGRLSSTQTINAAGTFIFKALCGSCITNEVTLYVNPLPTDQTCEEKGTIGSYFYKEPIISEFNCNAWAISECEKKGLSALSYKLDGDCCLFKCQSITPASCVDTDGLNYETKGRCTVVDGSYYFDGSDNCPSYFKLNEFSCISGRCVETLYTCPSNSCINGACVPIAPPIDSDGDGYSDADEIAAGSNPNDPYSTPIGGPAENCANKCKDINYAGSYYFPSGNLNSCQSYWYETCFNVHHLQYEASTYISDGGCCCGDCIGW